MALASSVAWEVDAATGNDANGGGFDAVSGTPGHDYTYSTFQTVISYTDLVIGGTTTQATSVARPFVANDVGNVIKITSGTGFTTGRYQIMSVSGGTATFDRSLGTTASTGGTGKLGGSLLTPAEAGSACVPGNTVWCKAGTYQTASKIVMNGGSSGLEIQLFGYQTTRGDRTGTRPLFQATADFSTYGILSNENGYNYTANINFDANGHTVVRAVYDGGYTGLSECKALGTGFTQDGGISFIDRCAAEGVIQAVCASRCSAKGGFIVQFASLCIAYNTGGSVKGFQRQQAGAALWNDCLAYNCGGDGFYVDGSNGRTIVMDRCLAVSNGGYGYNAAANGNLAQLIDSAAYGNTSGAKNNIANAELGTINTGTLSGNPLTNGAGGDFSLNNTAGAGAALRGVAFAFTVI